MKRIFVYVVCIAIVLIVVPFFSCCTKSRSGEVAFNSPNFIIIMADDLGFGDISCYGNNYIKTPNIDKLATEGIRFLDFHSNGAVCSPTRAALLTGKYQQRTGIGGVITAANHRDVGLATNEITIADELKKYGYNCGIFGKWHLGYDPRYSPVLQGFDQFKGFVSGNVDYHAHIDQEGNLDWWNDLVTEDQEGYTTDLITQYGVDFIESYNSNKTGKPFFLYLPHEAPHYPYQRRVDKVLRRIGEKGSEAIPADSIPGVYKEMVEIMDRGVGRIIQALKETGQDKNTVVIFCSDNGASKNGSNGVLRGYKSDLYEGGHRVPAIAWSPSKFKAGMVSGQPILTMDLLPTFLDFIEHRPQGNDIDGISIKDLLLSNKALPKRDLFWNFKNKNAIRHENWKLVSSKLGDKVTLELFDLSKDLAEKNNIAGDYPELARQLQQKLEDWRAEVFSGAVVVSE